MFFINEIKKILTNNPSKKIVLFVDMDGVIADYRFGEGEKIMKNSPGIYLKKRPVLSAIKIIKKLVNEPNLHLSILSSCLFQTQKTEKNLWLDKYAPFFKNKLRNILISDNFELRGKFKIKCIKKYLSNNKFDLAILVDDTHEILFQALKTFKEKVIPFHVITLFD